jgi:uncharacterized membrane protein YeaQ/YmgE (transglycosylase-associated protein family)
LYSFFHGRTTDRALRFIYDICYGIEISGHEGEFGMLNVFFWFVFGLLAGWVDVLASGLTTPRRTLRQMAVGVIGALVGGAGNQLLRRQKVVAVFSGQSIILAIVVAVLCVAASSLITDRHVN